MGGGVVFVMFYDSSFLFYFDVVCETVSFLSRSKPQTGGETERDGNVLRPCLVDAVFARQRTRDCLSQGRFTLKVQYTHPVHTKLICTCEDLLIQRTTL